MTQHTHRQRSFFSLLTFASNSRNSNKCNDDMCFHLASELHIIDMKASMNVVRSNCQLP